jgi:hypothetical protein
VNDITEEEKLQDNNNIIPKPSSSPSLMVFLSSLLVCIRVWEYGQSLHAKKKQKQQNFIIQCKCVSESDSLIYIMKRDEDDDDENDGEHEIRVWLEFFSWRAKQTDSFTKSRKTS